MLNQYSSNLPPGYQLHWYRIDRILGEGGFGITYLAYDANLDQKVAIKEFFPRKFVSRAEDSSIHPTLLDKQCLYEWGLDRFVEEAQILAKLRHKNIVTVHSVFRENKTAYIVMDHIEGKSLKTALHEDAFTDETAIYDLLYPILDSLSQVHQAGFIHRDIKPGNILLPDYHRPILIDFGSARQATVGESQELTTLVSRGYTPFEQYELRGDEKQGPWTDIYALGATLYKLVTQEGPIESVTRMANIIDQKQDPLIPATTLAKGKYSFYLLEAIDAALAIKPQDRPQSIAQWMQLIDFAATKFGYHQTDTTHLAIDEYIHRSLDREFKQSPHGARAATGLKTKSLLSLATALVLVIAVIVYQLMDYIDTDNQAQQMTTEKPLMAEPIDDTENIEPPLAATDETLTLEHETVQATITDLLTAASADIAAYRLTTPLENNALERYQKVLELDANNSDAKHGINKIANKYVELIDNTLAKGKLNKANEYMQKLSLIAPKHPTLAPLMQRLSTALSEVNSAKLAQREQQQIQWHVAQLHKFTTQHMANSQYTNALERFKEILSIVPNDIVAQQGLEKIASIYEGSAAQSIKAKKFSKATNDIAVLTRINPDFSAIANLRQQLTARQNAWQIKKTKDDQNQQKQNKIQTLLTQANNLLQKNHTISPKENNALKFFDAILELDPSNNQAQQGIEAIGQHYNQLAKQAIINQQFNQAKNYLQIANRLYSNADAVDITRQHLEQARTSYQQTQWVTENNLIALPPP